MKFTLFNRVPKNYISKKGYLVPSGGGELVAAILFIYNNGMCIVQEDWGNYEAIPISRAETDTTFKVNTNAYEKFIVTE